MPHPSEHHPVERALGELEAAEIAETMRALGTAGRLRLLVELLPGERSVEDLAAAAGLGQSATSHHLRLLRSLRLVRMRQAGRHHLYSLYDHHVAELLAAVRHHREHVHPPAADPVPAHRAKATTR
jgi:DNA-binding transcriptional ArsR family regulator